MINAYYLHFRDPVPADEVHDIFSVEDFPVDIKQVFPSSFRLATKLSYSKVQSALDFFYEEEHAPRGYALMKLKQDSDFIVFSPLSDSTTEPVS